MNREHEIITLVYEAKENNQKADQLVTKYLPFIKAETAKYIKRIPAEGHDDELSVAMFAFHEAALSYEKIKGAFLPYAGRVIRSRLIDYSRQMQRHMNQISLDESEDEDDRSLIEKIDKGRDDIHEYAERSAAKEEILHFTEELAEYGLSLMDIAESCPKQKRTLEACHRALAYAKNNPEIFELLTKSKKLPISQLTGGAKVEKKTLERHRKYMIAILLAYTNGFEIIRGHLKQIAPMKGGQPV